MDKIYVRKEKLKSSRTIRIPEELFERISKQAYEMDISINKAINYLLRYAVSKADFVLEDEQLEA